VKSKADDEAGKASSAIFGLWQMMTEGDTEAGKKLYQVAVKAIRHVDIQWCERFLKNSEKTEKLPEVERIIANLIRSSDEWPVLLSSIHEIRKAQIEKFLDLELGRDLPIKPGGGGRGVTRKITRNSPAGFTLELYKEIASHRKWVKSLDPEFLARILKDPAISDDLKLIYHHREKWQIMAERLPELSSHHRNREAWVDVMIELVRYMAKGDIESSQCPPFIHKRAQQFVRNGSKLKPIEEAIREKCERGLESLLHTQEGS
jgi:hypothetical protein